MVVTKAELKINFVLSSYFIRGKFILKEIENVVLCGTGENSM